PAARIPAHARGLSPKGLLGRLDRETHARHPQRPPPARPLRPALPRLLRDPFPRRRSPRLQPCEITEKRRFPCLMTYIERIHQWKALPPERKMQLRWDAIPLDVAQSMAFEREPVPEEAIRAIFARIEPPAMLKPHS